MIDENKIVNTLMEGLEDEEKDHIKKLDEKDLVSLHHGLGTYIRNTYSLWKNPWIPEIKNGVDHSPNHPDAISMRIIQKLYERLTT